MKLQILALAFLLCVCSKDGKGPLKRDDNSPGETEETNNVADSELSSQLLGEWELFKVVREAGPLEIESNLNDRILLDIDSNGIMRVFRTEGENKLGFCDVDELEVIVEGNKVQFVYPYMTLDSFTGEVQEGPKERISEFGLSKDGESLLLKDGLILRSVAIVPEMDVATQPSELISIELKPVSLDKMEKFATREFASLCEIKKQALLESNYMLPSQQNQKNEEVEEIKEETKEEKPKETEEPVVVKPVEEIEEEVEQPIETSEEEPQSEEDKETSVIEEPVVTALCSEDLVTGRWELVKTLRSESEGWLDVTNKELTSNGRTVYEYVEEWNLAENLRTVHIKGFDPTFGIAAWADCTDRKYELESMGENCEISGESATGIKTVLKINVSEDGSELQTELIEGFDNMKSVYKKREAPLPFLRFPVPCS